MYFLLVTPPQTLGTVSPASSATSTKVTGEDSSGRATVAACRAGARVHRQRGVVRASRSFEPSRTAEEPRIWRRENFIFAVVVSRSIRLPQGAKRSVRSTNSTTQKAASYYTTGAAPPAFWGVVRVRDVKSGGFRPLVDTGESRVARASRPLWRERPAPARR